MLAMWDRSAGREFQAARRVRHEYADAAELHHLEATLQKGHARWVHGGLERGEAEKHTKSARKTNA
jgi:hypothetical protein